MKTENEKILKYIIKELNNYKVQSKENFEERSEKISFALKILKEEKYKIPIKVQEDLISFCFDFINDLYSPSIECMYLYFIITGKLHCGSILLAPLELQKKNNIFKSRFN